jgi:hypothetical protein
MKLTIGGKFKAYLKEGTSAPLVEERYTGSPWVWFGADNLFPNAMRTLADNCVPLARCLEMAAMFIAGKGVKFKDKEGNEIEAAQQRFQQWLADTTEEDFLYATALDIALMNSYSWVIRRAAGSGIARLDHLDVSRVRTAKMIEGKIPAYYFSSDWSKVGTRGGASEERYKPLEVPAYDPAKPAPKELFYYRTYKQGRDYYGEPWYLSAVSDCEVWAKVPVFNKVQIDTGFKPTIHLHLPFDGDPKDIDQVVQDIQDAYTGAAANGLFTTFGNPGETAPALNPIERGDRAGELDLIRDNAEKVIVRGYGIPDILYRMDTSGGLTSQGSALKAALEQFESTFVEPKRGMIEKALTKLMNDDGIEVWECEIEELDVFEEEGATEKVMLAAMTVNELREEMDLPPLDDERGDKIPAVSGAAQPAQGQQPPPPAPDEEDPETPEEQ